MSHRIARSLEVMRRQFNEHSPGRRKASDGWIGDAAHRKSGSASDHNPWVKDGAMGVVTALDVTHDPANQVDVHAVADHMRQKRDPRVKYVISNWRIFSSTVQPWVWRRYTGSNGHTLHFHVSVNSAKKHYDDARSWDLGLNSSTAGAIPPSEQRPVLRRGSKGDHVRTVQRILMVNVDGDFGPITEAAVIAFQRAEKLKQDGIVGPITWRMLDSIEQLPTPFNYDPPHVLSEPLTL